MEHKKCAKCSQIKPKTEFFRNRSKKDGYSHACKLCKTADNRERYKAKKAQYAKTTAAYNARPDRKLVYRKRQVAKYWPELTPEEALKKYNQLLELQDNKCALCTKPSSDARALDVDHDHETGRVRGLVCNSCNIHLISKHTISSLKATLDYFLSRS